MPRGDHGIKCILNYKEICLNARESKIVETCVENDEILAGNHFSDKAEDFCYFNHLAPDLLSQDIGIETFNRISSKETVIKVSIDHIGPSNKLINTNPCVKKNSYESCIISQEIDEISFHKPLPFTSETPTDLKPNFDVWYPSNKKTINTHGMQSWSILSNNISYTMHPNTTTSNMKLNT